MQCTHYIILWHLAKVSEGSSIKVFNKWLVKSFLDAWQNTARFQDYVTEHLLPLGGYGDTEKADESFLLNVSALPKQHQHCSQRAGGIIKIEFFSFSQLTYMTVLQPWKFVWSFIYTVVFILGLHHIMWSAVDLQSPNYVFRPGTTWTSGLYTRRFFAGRAAQFHPGSCVHWSGWWQQQHRSESFNFLG